MTGHVLIFYHSASGNTQWVAGKLAASLPGCGIETEVRSIASRPRTDDLDSYDLIGFGCPVMGFRPSFAMTRFIQSLPPQAQKPAFLFTTCAGVLANTPWMLDGYLSVRGFVVLADQHFRAEVSCPLPGPPVSLSTADCRTTRCSLPSADSPERWQSLQREIKQGYFPGRLPFPARGSIPFIISPCLTARPGCA